MRNPYAPNLKKETFEIRYEGKADAFFCFRIVLRNHKTHDAYAFRADVSDWAIQKAKHRAIVGNGFGASKDHPTVPFSNLGYRDVFVLFSDLGDVLCFEKRYPVLGFSPTMTM